jgi:putative ABC transport system substrate-binding protein
MITRRGLLRLIAASACGVASSATARSDVAERRVGILFWGTQAFAWKLLRPGLLEGFREAGLTEGRDLALEWRFSDGDGERDRKLAAELIAARCSVVISAGKWRAATLLKASPTVAVVATGLLDPVESGFARSLNRPAGRVTGIVTAGDAMTTKQIQLMQELYPRMRHVTILVGTTRASRRRSARPAPARGWPTSRASRTTSTRRSSRRPRFRTASPP